MIDTQLVAKAKKCSPALIAADSSWRGYVEQIRKNAFHLPFTGNYTLMIKDQQLLIEGYVGQVRIDKLHFCRRTYFLKQPVIYGPFRIFGVYDNQSEFKFFTAQPLIGFHYMGMDSDGIHSICTGDLQWLKPTSLEVLQQESSKIVNAFRLINMESLGQIFLPAGYEKLQEIFSNKEESLQVTFDKLKNENLIEEIL